MSQWLQWIILSSVTGSPVLSAVILLTFWWGVDRFTFRFLPSPVRAFNRWRRQAGLRQTLMNNPHDRRARHELSELLVERGRYKDAVEVLKPNLEAGDDDASTLYVMGVACLGAGHVEQGEVFLDEASRADPAYRLGGIDLERGRWRLKRGDAKGAREALERFVATRKGTVEGRLLLARALELGRDDAAGALMREEAWREYVAAPRFQRNVERFWAWRAKPSRPALYAAIVLILVVLLGRVVAPRLSALAETYRQDQASQQDDE